MTLVKTNKNGTGFPTVWSDFFNSDKFFNNRWFENEFEQTLPAVNIKEKNDEFNIEFAAPGFKKTDFKIDVSNNTITISADKETVSNDNKENYTRQEYSYNSFSRSFALPTAVNSDKIEANYKDGILKLEIPKKEEAKALPKKEIKVG